MEEQEAIAEVPIIVQPKANFIRANNGYSFHCPVVDRDTRFMACEFMKMKLWRGDSIPKADCACAMRGGKCPAVLMIKMEGRGEANFFDREVTMHRIPKEIIEQVSKIILVPSQANGDDLTLEQQERLFARGVALAVDASTFGDDKSGAPIKTAPRKRAAKSGAAAPGDLTDGLSEVIYDKSALINQAMETLNDGS